MVSATFCVWFSDLFDIRYVSWRSRICFYLWAMNLRFRNMFFFFFPSVFFNVQSKNGLPKHAAFQIHKTRPTLCPLASWLKASRASAAPRAAIRRALQDCRSLPETPTSTKITKHWQNPPDFWSFLVEKTLQLERISPYRPPRRVLWPKQFLNPMLEGFWHLMGLHSICWLSQFSAIATSCRLSEFVVQPDSLISLSVQVSESSHRLLTAQPSVARGHPTSLASKGWSDARAAS